jgi:sirohydrochlorin ferrochelatase
MHGYARQLASQVGVAAIEVAFMAAASPRLSELLPQLPRPGDQSVVIQPHLVYPGEVLRDLRQQVTARASEIPQFRLILAGHLGPAPQLADLIVRAV